MIQYSAALGIESRSRSLLDTRFRGYDGLPNTDAACPVPTCAYPLHQFAACNFPGSLAVKRAMLSPPSAPFRAHYEALVASGAIQPDAAQAEAAEAFADLEQRLASYKPVRKQGLLGRLLAAKNGGRPRARRLRSESGPRQTAPMEAAFLP